jgi:hypothetical protein
MDDSVTTEETHRLVHFYSQHKNGVGKSGYWGKVAGALAALNKEGDIVFEVLMQQMMLKNRWQTLKTQFQCWHKLMNRSGTGVEEMSTEYFKQCMKSDKPDVRKATVPFID